MTPIRSGRPTAAMLAFVSDRSATRFDEVHRDVWVVPVRRKATTAAPDARQGDCSAPRWSPDGMTIAYVGHENEQGDSAPNTHLLVVSAAEPKRPRSLSASLDRTVWGLMGAPGGTHAWSEDGTAVLFVAADRGTLAIYRSSLEDPRPELLLGGDRQITALHTSGRTIAFAPNGRRPRRRSSAHRPTDSASGE